MADSAERPFSYSVSAPGKVILFGEHSVVYGKPAVAATLGKRTVAHVKEISGPKGTVVLELPQLEVCVSFDGLFKKIQHLGCSPDIVLQIPMCEFSWRSPEGLNLCQLRKIVCSIMEEYSLMNLATEKDCAITAFLMLFLGFFVGVDLKGKLTRLGGLVIRLESDVPMCAGLGSSAAYGVSLSGALVQLLQIRIQQLGCLNENISGPGYRPSIAPSTLQAELDIISRWAFISEVVMHGKPSGLDNSVCTYGSAVQFHKGKKPVSILIPSNLKVLLIDTGVPRNTVQLVSNVAEKRKRLMNVVTSILDAMESVAVEVITVLKCMHAAGDRVTNTSISLLEELVDVNQSLLAALGVSHPRLDEIVKLAASTGFHAKLTGAGGGGYAFVFLFPTLEEDKCQLLKTKLAHHNFHYIETAIGEPGIMLHKENVSVCH